MKAVLVAGARPNFMKVAPVLHQLEQRGVETSLVHSGQHYDDAMSDVFFRDLRLRRPDAHLGVGSGSHAQQTARIMQAFEELPAAREADLVVVVGDVNSTVACGLVAAKAGTYLAHVEAGLRSRDWSMPEEVNRVVTDRVSDFLFAPSQDAADNLRDEGYRTDQVHLVGNVMVDTLLDCLDRARERNIVERLQLPTSGFGLVTLHRPSNVDDPAVLAGLVRALGEVAAHCPLVFPVHPRTRQRLQDWNVPDGILVVDPVGYLDSLALQDSAAIVLTDSGGIQEESTVLGVPCLTLRESTERPITVAEGTNTVVGTDPDEIVGTAIDRLSQPPAARRPILWDGRAAERIVDVLTSAPLDRHRRPTERETVPCTR